MENCDVLIWDKKIGEIYFADGRLLFRYTTVPPFEISPFHVAKDNVAPVDFTDLLGQRSLAGVFNDSLPDLYGEKALDAHFSTFDEEANVIDKLLFIGNKTMGAITYAPRNNDKKAKLQNIKLSEIHDKIRDTIDNKFIDLTLSLDILLSVSPLGGAKPKALIGYKDNSSDVYLGARDEKLPKGYFPSIIKLCTGEKGATHNDLKTEYTYMSLAKSTGMNVPEIAMTKEHHYVIRRFDKVKEVKYHVHTLQGLIHSDFAVPRTVDYTEAFRVLIALKCKREDSTELFKRMVFNYLFRNHDDHEKNISFVMDRKGKWSLSPVYDITFAYKKGGRFIGDHQLKFNGKVGSDVSYYDFKDIAEDFSIDNYQEIFKAILKIRDTKLEDMLLLNGVEKEYVSVIMEAVNERGLDVR